MKAFGIFLVVIGTIGLLAIMIAGVVCHYQWNSSIGSYWDLSEKASSIALKSDYLDKYVAALENAGLHGSHDAVWFRTPNNDYKTKDLKPEVEWLYGRHYECTVCKNDICELITKEQYEEERAAIERANTSSNEQPAIINITGEQP